MKTTSKVRESRRPSLLEPESTGGGIASAGLRFQSNVALTLVPRWLAQEGFTSMVIESMGDIEAKFFMPGQGDSIEFVEVKNHSVSPTEFWREVKRFRTLDESCPGMYSSFTLVCAGVSPRLAPLLNALNRIRGPLDFYSLDTAVGTNSFKDYLQIVKRLRHSKSDGRFLFERVQIDTNLVAANQNGTEMFLGSLCAAFPEYKMATANNLQSAAANLCQLIESRLNQTITRKDLETALDQSIDPGQIPHSRPIHLHTLIQDNDQKHPTALRFRWTRFWGGDGRNFPAQQEWNEQLLRQLDETRNWIVQHRNIRRIMLTGNRRLSTSLAIGSVMSAVAGFAIEMELRDGEIWRSDDHANAETQDFPLATELIPGNISSLALVVSIGREILSQVRECLPILGLEEIPILSLHSTQPVVSASQANLIVTSIKQKVSKTLEQTNCRDLHLFFSGPAFVALLMGHRLNAVAPIQCYEWVASGKYVATCRL